MAERNFGAKEGRASSSRASGAAGRQLAHSSPFPHRTEQHGTTERFFSESLPPGSQKAQSSGLGSKKLSARLGDLRGKTSVLVDASRMSDHRTKNRSARAMERESGESRREPLPRLASSDENRPDPSSPGQLADSEDLDDSQVEDGVSVSEMVRSRRGTGAPGESRHDSFLPGQHADSDTFDGSLVEEAVPASGCVRSRRGTVATGERGLVSSRPGQHADSDILDDSMDENAVPSSGKKQLSGLFRNRRGAGRSSRRTVEAGVSGPDPSLSGQLADSDVLDDSLVEEAGPPSGWVRSRRGAIGSRRGT